MDIIWPVFWVVGQVIEFFHWSLFSWWLDPWVQRRSNRVLWEDVQTHLFYLFPEGQLVKEKTKVLPFDYDSIRVAFRNLIITITRGRGELNVSLSQRHQPDVTYRLGVVLAALDQTRNIGTLPYPEKFWEFSDFLRSRIDTLNEVFSDSQFPEFKQKLESSKKAERKAIKELEWQLNSRR
jgi:hypothetical protein